MSVKNMLTSASNSISKFAGRTGLKIQKHSPEILLGVGIVGFVGTVVLACRATLAADEVLDQHHRKMKDIDDAVEIAEENPEEYGYDEELVKKDKLVVYTKTAVNMAKLYAPTIAVGSLSLACILVSRNIMQKRYLGAVAAYNAVSTAFNEYRRRVIDEAGVVMDRHYRYGTEIETIETEVVDENGKKKKVKEIVEKPGTGTMLPDDTSRWLDESNKKIWDRNTEFVMMNLRGLQNYCNDILRTRGHIFLNEVYDALGFPMTQAGAVLGWIDGEGDGHVDFGLYSDEKQARDFVNGNSDAILLQFNHDGVIWDKI